MQLYTPKRPFEVCLIKNDTNFYMMDSLIVYRLKGTFAG